MKRNIRLVCISFAFALIFLWQCLTASSQELKLLPGEVLPELKDTKVNVKTSLDEASGIFYYSYKVTNSRSSTGEIWLFGVDITRPTTTLDPGSDGITNGQRFLRHGSAFAISNAGLLLVPVGLVSPSNWTSSVTVRGTAGWGSSDAPFNIRPGQSLNGFEITSRGLPGIRTVSVEPRFNQTPVEEATAEDEKRIKEIENAIVVTLKSVGPTAPPKDFVAIEFLNYLISLVYDSHTNGWIKPDGIRQSLLARLINAKRQLEKGQNKPAKNILKAFLNEVQATSCQELTCRGNKPLTSEAYALLFFNGEFLHDRL